MKDNVMLYILVFILVSLWLAGLLTSYIMGGFIDLLLVIAIIAIVLELISGRRMTSPLGDST
jgi:hypothetical protein